MNKIRFLDMVWTPDENKLKSEIDWIKKTISEIGEQTIIKMAKDSAKVRKNAYQPYSKYSVGAVVLGKSGRMYASCNSECVSWTETDHAERSAITRAVAEGELKKSGRRFIKAIAISHSSDSAPCGGCRQRTAEHADNCLVINVFPNGKVKNITSLKILFPYEFTPTHLGFK